MSQNESPSTDRSAIKATVVGSYPVPSWLLASPSRPHLRDAIMTVLKTQELAGIDVISDGELSRFDPSHPETQGMIDYFIRPLDGVMTEFSRDDIAAFQAEGRLTYRTKPAGIVSEGIGAGNLNLPAEFDFFKGLTDRPLKYTLTSPYMLAQVLMDRHYNDKKALAEDIAEVLRKQVADIDAEVVQVDEANLTGHPDDWPWAVETINHVLGGVKGEGSVHLCFGNYGGQSVQKGFWHDLVPFFNALEAGHVVLEFARRGYGEIEAFKDVKPELKIGVGVIDVKDNEVETSATIAKRIEDAVKVLGQDRVEWVHPDCGLWMLQRSVADRKLVALVQGRNLFLGRSNES